MNNFRFSFIVILLAGYTATSHCQTDITYHIAKGWNILSVPLKLANTRRQSVFPTAISGIFTYTGCGKCFPDTVPRNLGFFIKFASAQIITISGIEQTADTLTVKSGWNLVGSHNISVPIDNIITEPPNILTSGFYVYTGGHYQRVYTLEPEYGFWVRANQPGKIILK